MIQVFFELGNENILVVIKGKSVKFGSTEFGARLADISGLKLSYVGATKEFPDLLGRKDWKKQTIKRFKEKISRMDNEKEVCSYIIEELTKTGYTPKYKQEQGFRPRRING